MDYLNDCNSYINSKSSFIKDIEKNLPDTSYRFVAPIKIISYANNIVKSKKGIDQDLQNIIEHSFTYLYENIELLNVFYEKYFNKTFSVMKKYDQLINYILYLEDVSYVLNNEKKSKEIDAIIKQYESILITKNSYDESLFDNISPFLDSLSKKQLYSQQEIFEMVVEELNL